MQRYATAAVAGTYSGVVLALATTALAGINMLEGASPWVAAPAIIIVPLFLAVPVALFFLPAGYVMHRILKRLRLAHPAFHCLAGTLTVISTFAVIALAAFAASSEYVDPYEAQLSFDQTQWPMDLAFHATWILSSAIGGYTFFATRNLGAQPNA
ncbi:hypothetical protein NBH20_07655 [Rhizobium sp. S153]|nr:hypothetical protein [Ciceribacter sp. S153]MCM2401027.1 hypothetical protein [Ciceribacter sp. S153]